MAKTTGYVVRIYKETESESGATNEELVYSQVFPESFEYRRLITDLNRTEFNMATTRESMLATGLAMRHFGPDKTLKPLSNDQ
jgi:hypothetical protein